MATCLVVKCGGVLFLAEDCGVVRIFWLVIVISFGWTGGIPCFVYGQTKGISSLGIQLPVLRTPTTETDAVQKRVSEWFRLWRLGQFNAALLSCKEIHQLQQEMGISNLFLFSNTLVLLGDQLRKQGKYDQAHALYSWANTVAPDVSRPYFRLSWSTLILQPTRLHVAARFFWHGLLTKMRSPLEVATLAAGTARFLFWTLGVAFLLFWICLLLRCLRPFLMDLRELFPPGVTPFQMSLMSVMLLFLPPLMGAGLLDTLLFWVLFSWFYQNTRERFLTTGGLVLVSLLPIACIFLGKLVGLVHSPTQALYVLNQSEVRVESAKKLQVALEKTPKDIDLLWSLGLYFKRKGDLQTARLYYEKALKLSTIPALQVNLGNLYFIERDVEKAFATYKKAIQSHHIPEGLFNISQILKHSSSTASEVVQQKVDALQEALRGGGQRVERFERQEKTHWNRYIMDVELPSSRYWQRILERPEYTDIFSRLWPSLSSWIPAVYAPWVGVGVAVLLWLLLPLGRRFFCGCSCSQCGLIFRVVTSDTTSSTHCSQCEQLNQKKEGFSPARRVQKEIEIQRYQRWRYYSQAILATFLVGSGHIMRQKTAKGFFLFLCAATTVFLWIFSEPFLVSPFSLGDTHSLWLTLGMTVWTGWLYFLSLRETLSHS